MNRQEMETITNGLAEVYGYRPLSPEMSLQCRTMFEREMPVLDPAKEVVTVNGIKIASGFTRIVIGDYGAFVEISPDQIDKVILSVKNGQSFRTFSDFKGKYVWLTDNNYAEEPAKIYKQLRGVSYADYKAGMYYISPYEIKTEEVSMNKVSIAATGHRPRQLNWGYNNNAPKWVLLKRKIKEILLAEKCTEAISGMALGVDTIFAKAVLELKAEGHNIKLVCAIPCAGQDSQWMDESKEIYADILSLADEIVMVSEAAYSPALMQRRNEYMVDRADKVLAIWNGNPGGTGNCVNYAKSVEKEIIQILPSSI